jgi:hypothetical protein
MLCWPSCCFFLFLLFLTCCVPWVDASDMLWLSCCFSSAYCVVCFCV